ncbi:MAG: hypothetical protein ACKVQS_10950 [Fimbriimonadaceae bacterium]
MTGQSHSFLTNFKVPLWAAILFLALAPGIIFAPALFSGKTIGPFDQMSGMIPGQSAKNTDRSWDILQADGALQFYGWRDLVFEAHRTGKAPFWNPYQLAGTPLLANGQSAPYYPLHILFGKLGCPTGPAIVLLAWTHLAIVGLGLFALTRRLGAGIEGALLGGFCLALSPFAIAWSALASVMTACCWIPVLLAAQLSLIQKPSWRTALATCGAAAMLLTAGHLQFIFYGLFAWLIFTPIAFFTQSEKPKPTFTILASALAFGLAGFAALPQINPTLEFSKTSSRKSVATEEGYASYAASAIQPWEFLGTLAPAFMGTPGHPDNSGTGENIPSTISTLIKPGGNYAESAIWLGVPVILGLCLLGKRTNWKQASPIIAIGVVGLLLAVGSPLAKLLYFGIPGFSSTGSPGRAAIIFVMAACAFAALAIPQSSEESDPKAKAYPYFGLLGFALATILASTQLTSLKSWMGYEMGPIIARRTTEGLPVLVIALIAAAGAWYFWSKKGWLAIGTVCAIAAQLISVPTQILPFSAPPKIHLDALTNQRVAFVNKNWDFIGVSKSTFMPPNFATIGRIQDIGGYDSLLAKSTVDILKEINGEDPAPPTNGNMMFLKQGLSAASLSEAGVTKVFSKFAVDQLTQTDQIGDVRVYDVAGPGIFSLPTSSPNPKTLNSEGFTLVLEDPGDFTARYANLPGWQMTVNGKPIPINQGKWIEATLPAGVNEVHLKYIPPGFLPWPWLPAILAVLAAIAPFVPLKKQQNDENPVNSKSDEA